MADYVRVKGLGNVPIEAFPKGYRVRTKDGKRLSPSQIPLNMLVSMKDETRAQIINLMKQRGLRLVDETQKINGRTFVIQRALDGRVTKTDIDALPRYADVDRQYRAPEQPMVRKLEQTHDVRNVYYNSERAPYTYHVPIQYTRTPTPFVPKDKYNSFEELVKGETEGTDFRIEFKENNSNVIVIAIHGGNTEPGTTELANAIAGNDLNYYSFVSNKRADNSDLHITSSKFDEPIALEMVDKAYFVLSLHGAGDSDEVVYLGGRNTVWGQLIKEELETRGFKVDEHKKANLSGTTSSNVVNMGITGQGVQIELSRGLRKKMFNGGLNDRLDTTSVFRSFVDGIRFTLRMLSDDPIDRVEELVKHVIKAQVTMEENYISLLDFQEELIEKLADRFDSDVELDDFYKKLEVGDEEVVSKLPEVDKKKYNELRDKVIKEEKRIERIREKIDRIVTYHVKNSAKPVLMCLRELMVEAVPSSIKMIDEKVE